MDCAWTELESRMTTNSGAVLMRSAITLGTCLWGLKAPVRELCATVLVKVKVESVGSLDITTRRHRGKTADRPTGGGLIHPQVIPSPKICPEQYRGARNAPNKICGRDEGRESRLIAFRGNQRLQV